MNAHELGRTGEAVAAKYYLNKGYQLLAHNYKTRMGELDLVMDDGETVIIAEVKTRSNANATQPADAVTVSKQQRLICAAQRFIQQKHLTERFIRFDVVEVIPQDCGWYVHCIKNAFEV